MFCLVAKQTDAQETKTQVKHLTTCLLKEVGISREKVQAGKKSLSLIALSRSDSFLLRENAFLSGHEKFWWHTALIIPTLWKSWIHNPILGDIFLPFLLLSASADQSSHQVNLQIKTPESFNEAFVSPPSAEVSRELFPVSSCDEQHQVTVALK